MNFVRNITHLKKYLETAGKKNNDMHKEENLSTTYIKSSYPCPIQKFFIPLFSASHDTLKTRVFRNNAIPLRIYLL